MSNIEGLKRNQNPKYLTSFERYHHNAYQTQLSLWVPGIVTEVKCTLNMRGEKCCVYLEKVLLGSLQVNTTRDYASSVYFDSSLQIKCAAPASQIVSGEGSLPEYYDTSLTDQYGSIVSELLFAKAKGDPQRYLYHQ